MRKILLTALLAAGGLTASAQYLPNGDFEQWKTTCGKSDQTSFNGEFPYSPVGLKIARVQSQKIGMVRMSIRRLLQTRRNEAL